MANDNQLNISDGQQYPEDREKNEGTVGIFNGNSGDSLVSLALSEDVPEDRALYVPMDSGSPCVYGALNTSARPSWRAVRDVPLYETPKYPPMPVTPPVETPGGQRASLTASLPSSEYSDHFHFQSPRSDARPPLPTSPPPVMSRPARAWADLHMWQTSKGFLKFVPRRHGASSPDTKTFDQREDRGLSPGSGRKLLEGNLCLMCGLRTPTVTAVQIPRQLMVPIHLIRPTVNVDCCNTYFVYFEGPMGVGKSTLINTASGILPGEKVVIFQEPMSYWKHVFTDCHREIYKVLKMGKVGDPGTSDRLYACQCKFALPFRTRAIAVQRMVQPWRVGSESTRGTHWCFSDRHLLSSAVVFPLLHLKMGRLSFDHFVQLLANFCAMECDIIVIVSLRSSELLRRIMVRGRKNEENVDKNYVREMAWAYHAVYCSWVMLRYITVEQMVQLCTQTTTIPDICFNSYRLGSKEDTLKTLLDQSMIPLLAGILYPVRYHPVIIELCFGFFQELCKVQFIIANGDNYEENVCGLWTDIYRQIITNPAIKPRTVNWQALESQAKALLALEKS
ncbi:thymidine kinase [Colobine gammaherpesvirus 1]|uniref:Thymidine kinase n=1 Tax=Colobine gammaherpesvirus 1 TaxID=2597325 RepID=A0A5B8G6I8_9GAMA|nr:thymidine kinase [Colobine gammaherpesvirus 1]QDQ69229.1 thymidine kinase [Colobine gammaherpesvirus 1]